jgi:hypothetical protein
MVEPTKLADFVKPVGFLNAAAKATTAADVDSLLAQLPVVSEHDYSYHEGDSQGGWQVGKFHWIPVGGERGNAGRIKQANYPVNPIAERTINGMEALIELERQRELLANPGSIDPISPRDAVKRYYELPSLDELPKLGESASSRATRAKARELARRLRVRLVYSKTSREFTVAIEDEGIGQTPAMMHRTLLSLGSTTKADKWYLIGVFGQGGSSAYAVSNYSWIMSRRAPGLLNDDTDGVGWTVVKHVFPRGRRDDYFAYLASSPNGHVPSVSAADADQAKIGHGTRFVHIGYNFGSGGSAITRQLYQALNHVLFNPVLPFELYVGSTIAPVYGNGYRLSSLGASKATTAPALDKVFPPQPVGL